MTSETDKEKPMTSRTTRPDYAELNLKLSDLINGEPGWAVMMIPGTTDNGHSNLAYTVGLTENFNHPEIAMIAFDLEMMRNLINDVAARLVKVGQRFDTDWATSDEVIDHFHVFFREIPSNQAGTIAKAAKNRYHDRGGFRLMQMFLPDANGLFPWNEGCRPEYAEKQGIFLQLMACGGKPS
jgi:hypothetical protein